MKLGFFLLCMLTFGLHSQASSCHEQPAGDAVAQNQNRNGRQSLVNANVRIEMNSSNDQDTDSRVSENTWGGEHVQIVWGPDGAEVEFDCAHGVISETLKTDASGNFDLPGTFVREGGGPVRSDRAPDERAVRYLGRIQDHHINLSLTFTDSNENAGTFELVKGRAGRLRKCR